MISRERFVAALNALKQADDLQDSVNEKIFKFNMEMSPSYDFDNYGIMIIHKDLVLDLLSEIMEDEYDDINYFVYELDYGRTYVEGSATDKDGTPINAFSDAGLLYNYLLKSKKE